MFCSTDPGLCEWVVDDEGSSHEIRKIWAPQEGEQLIDYRWQGQRIAILVRGHMSPGRVILINREGKEALIHQLSNGLSLGAVTGYTEDVGHVLCDNIRGNSHCGTWLPTVDSPARPLSPPWLMSDCLFPRFVGGAIYCLAVDLQQGLTLQSFADQSVSSRQVQHKEIDERIPDDIYHLTGRRFLLHSGESLFLISPDRPAQLLVTGNIQWVQEVAQTLFWSQCEVTDDLRLARCSISRVALDGAYREIWDSTSRVPIRLATTEAGTLFLQVAGFGKDAYGEGQWEVIRFDSRP
jgi:hypothetical protein